MKARLSKWLWFVPQWVLEHRSEHDCDDEGCGPYNMVGKYPPPIVGNSPFDLKPEKVTIDAMRVNKWGFGHRYHRAKWDTWRFNRNVRIADIRLQNVTKLSWWELERMNLETALRCLIEAAKGISGYWRVRNVWTNELIPAEALGVTYEGRSLTDQMSSAQVGGQASVSMPSYGGGSHSKN